MKKIEKYYKSFRYRAYPNKGTIRRTIKIMAYVAAPIYNKANNERKETYKESKIDNSKKPVNSYRQQYRLVRKRDHPEYGGYDAQMLQNVLVSLDADWKSFFTLNKHGFKDAHPPGNKGIHRNLTLRQSGWRIEGNNLLISTIGKFKMRMHRPIEGKPKTASITLKSGKWYVSISCESEKPAEKNRKRKPVEIYFPPDTFIKDSVGLEIDFPEFYFSRIGTLKKLSRALSKKKGSKNRRKARYMVAKWHEKTANKRAYFLWQIVFYYTNNYSEIIVPKLPLKYRIQYATTSKKAMKLCDASYGLFMNMLRQKCKEKGVTFIERKDEEWGRQINKAEQAAQMEHAQKLLRKAKKAMKYQNPAHLKSLERDLKRVPILQS
ncbi:MAG TPA: transposase [Planctomycetes bacterium]|nr:transposase [Planctomycetota bacterium]